MNNYKQRIVAMAERQRDHAKAQLGESAFCLDAARKEYTARTGQLAEAEAFLAYANTLPDDATQTTCHRDADGDVTHTTTEAVRGREFI